MLSLMYALYIPWTEHGLLLAYTVHRTSQRVSLPSIIFKCRACCNAMTAAKSSRSQKEEISKPL